jgi:ferredoxin, 2Fe-2S
MPKVTFLPDGNSIEVPRGTSVLEAAKKCHAQVGYACGGVCACSTCHVYVRQGLDTLGEQSEKEEDILDKAFDVRPSSRLGCQARVSDQDVTVEITPESRKAWFDEHPEEREKKSAG